MQAMVGMTDHIGGDSPDFEQQRQRYFVEIVKPLAVSFTNLLQSSNFAKDSQKPAVMMSICNTLEKFRGVARATLWDDTAVFNFCAQFFNAFGGLVEVYKNCPEMIVLILKFYCDFTEFQARN